MRHDTTSLRLKRASGWFAAGAELREAMEVLSDGAFKLFAYVCLSADRRTGRIEATHQELARAIRKSKRIVGRYVVELEGKGVCRVHSGKNQHSRTVLEVADAYWPYHRDRGYRPGDQEDDYVAAVREAYLEASCGSGTFGPSDERTARDLERRGVPVSVVKDAILIGTSRKWVSLLNGATGPRIKSVRYFEPIIAEFQERPLTADYRQYLRRKNAEFACAWKGTRSAGAKR